MHRCLSIPEIVGNICDHFESAFQGPSTLAALARTSRNFHGPALDCLWAVQDRGMNNLLRCMPSDLFEFTTAYDVHLLRPILTEDWERPLVYMPRIRRMIVHAYSGVANIFPALSASLPGDAESLFPRMRALHWFSGKDFLCIRMLLSPRLNDLYLSVEFSNANYSLLCSIPRICPALKILSIHGSDTGRSALSRFLRGLHSLESLTVSIPDLATLEHLSQLRGLTSLNAFLPDGLSLSSLSPLGFIALEKLGIHYEIEEVTSFFRRCSGARLKEITIDFSSSSTTAATDRLHNAIRESCSHTLLSSLGIHMHDDEPPEPGNDAYAINIQSLRFLFCFVNLTSISIISYVGFNIDDEAMKELARAWPRIQILRLRFAPYNDSIRMQPQLSLRCLHTLAEHCQSLTELEITFDATVILQPDPSSSPRRISQSALRILNVGKSSMASPAIHIARTISMLFPSVSNLTTYRTYSDNDDPDELEEHEEAIAHHNLWMEVAVQLPILKVIREEERVWTERRLLGAQSSLS
ncbi:hypothetical protein C8R45DRAFT_190758 [Mycena sanguinolenta]|nr:hypothetical protein C8R45DRAFT_190758 [Mycena sanguinolenta]